MKNQKKKDDNKHFGEEIASNLTEIKNALKKKEAKNVIIFLILNGLVSPSFGNFTYYF